VRYVSLAEVLDLHRRVVGASGGSLAIRDLGALKAAVAQPHLTFEGADLYPTLAAKAGALCHALACDHPFVDGNKRTAHAAMETMLLLNGHELTATVDEQESIMLAIASGERTREQVIDWVRLRMHEVGPGA
jgi:death-on-curing protein